MCDVRIAVHGEDARVVFTAFPAISNHDSDPIPHLWMYPGE